ncbi:MAG: hypothetical protein ACRC2T_13525 [Thermoguttaceae bacterium]
MHPIIVRVILVALFFASLLIAPQIHPQLGSLVVFSWFIGYGLYKGVSIYFLKDKTDEYNTDENNKESASLEDGKLTNDNQNQAELNNENNFGKLYGIDSVHAVPDEDTFRNIRPYYTAITFIVFLICTSICETIYLGLTSYFICFVVILAILYLALAKVSPTKNIHHQPADRSVKKNAFELNVCLWIFSPILLLFACLIVPSWIRGANWIQNEEAGKVFVKLYFLLFVFTAISGVTVFVSYLLGGLFTGIFTFFAKRK